MDDERRDPAINVSNSTSTYPGFGATNTTSSPFGQSTNTGGSLFGGGGGGTTGTAFGSGGTWLLLRVRVASLCSLWFSQTLLEFDACLGDGQSICFRGWMATRFDNIWTSFAVHIDDLY